MWWATITSVGVRLSQPAVGRVRPPIRRSASMTVSISTSGSASTTDMAASSAACWCGKRNRAPVSALIAAAAANAAPALLHLPVGR